MREDTIEKQQRIEELKNQRDEIKARIQKAKAELKQMDKELKIVTLEAARTAIEARQKELQGEIESLQNKLLVLKEGVLETWHGEGFALILQEVYCGKHCKSCPHGPYWRVVWREEGKVVLKHIGPAEGKKAISKEEAYKKARALQQMD